jgi:hypothetical protein
VKETFEPHLVGDGFDSEPLWTLGMSPSTWACPTSASWTCRQQTPGLQHGGQVLQERCDQIG